MAHSLMIHGYEVMVGAIASQLNEWLENEDFSAIFVLVDENTKRECLPLIDLNEPFETIEILSGEVNKNLNTCSAIWEQLLNLKADRNALLINLGGGVITDMGSFCAATYKRGINWINIPTTLLSQVDATIGGKTGVDFNSNKNMIGLFSDPKAVFIDTVFLNTLNNKQIVSGKMEMLKHGLIADKDHFEKVLVAREITDELTLASMFVKKGIVERDPFEQNVRKTLNFGHTIGHALESQSLNTSNALLHGEAVGWGMIAALYLSSELNNLPRERAEQTIQILKKELPAFPFTENEFKGILEIAQNDKKSDNGAFRFVLLSEIGKAEFDVPVKESDVIKALKFCLEL